MPPKVVRYSFPKVAIVGRPNVGKSSLFNRIVGFRKAIVEPSTGTTRDRLFADVKWKGKNFTLIDTGGFKVEREDLISKLVLRQLEMAIKESDIIFFVVDARSGILPQDKEIALKLRKTSKKIYLVVNKVDDKKAEEWEFDFFELGLGKPFLLSAMHNYRVDKLLNDLALAIEKNDLKQLEEIKVAIIGRPNVGKSSYLNTLLNEERVIVHPIAGTTRDSIDTKFNYKGKNYIIIDTAGIRHPKKIKEAVDFYGTLRSKETIKRSDIAIVILDGYDGLREDDSKIIDLVLKEGKGLIVAVNKWDLVKGFEMSKYKEMLLRAMGSLNNFPIIFISSKTGRNVKEGLDLVDEVYANYTKSLPAYKLNETIQLVNNCAHVKRKGIKFGYITQVGIAPPKFIAFANRAKMIEENLRNFLENFLRKSYDFKGVPIFIKYKEK